MRYIVARYGYSSNIFSWEIISETDLTAAGVSPASRNFVLKYTNKLISGWSWDKTDYFVILKDGKVTEYGSGEVRERNVGGIHTIFIHQF